MGKQQQVIIPRGGLNITAHSLDVAPERLLIAQNYELDEIGRPRRIEGFERFDGQPSPSAFEPTSWTDEADYKAQLLAGIEARRALIAAVPGEGGVKGVGVYKGVIYAWRHNVGATLLDCYKSTSSGWSKVNALSGKTVLAGTSKVRTCVANFQASGSRGIRMYIVDGTSFAQEWDGTTATSLATGLTGKPFFVAEHKNHLWLCFPNGSLVNSATGDPTNYATAGAAEISIPSDLTGVVSLPGGVLAITCVKRIELLYGSSTIDFNKVIHSETAGAVIDSVQVLGDALMLDGNSVTFLQRTQAFGDFRGSGISADIASLAAEAMNDCVGSAIYRKKGQYRIYLSDGRVICATFNGSTLLGWTLSQLTVTPNCVAVGDDTAGDEGCYIGCDDGFVYKTDTGRSFDGESIVAVARLAFSHCGSPGQIKRFHALTIEGIANADTVVTVVPDLTYSDEDESPVAESHEFTIQGAGGFYDSGVWDAFLWNRPVTFHNKIPITGSGHNISIVFSSDSAIEESHTILAVSITYSVRGRAA